MKLAELLSDMIANGATIEQVRVVVDASKRHEDARDVARREKTAARVRKHRASVADVTLVTQVTPVTRYTPVPPEKEVPTPLEKQTPLTPTDPHQPAVGAPPKPARRRSQIEPDAQPTPPDRTAADNAGMTPATFRVEWGQFRDRHVSQGNVMADWRAAWRTWVGNWVKFGCRQHGHPPPSGPGGNTIPFARTAPTHVDALERHLERLNQRSRAQHSSDGGADRDESEIIPPTRAFAV